MAISGMTAGQPAEPGKSHSFEQVWATMDRIAAEAAERQKEADKRQKEYAAEADKRHAETERVLREVGERHAETERVLREVGERHAETEKVIKEVGEKQKETDRQMKETAEQMKETAEQMKETDRQMKKTDMRLDRLSQNVGGLSHSLGELVETLVAARLWEKFDMYGLERGYQRVLVYDGKRAVAEIDILLSNTNCAVAVEVKTHLDKIEYVDRHIARMELIRKFPPAEVAINSKRVMGALAGGVVSPETKEYAHQCGFYVLELSGESARLADTPAGFKAREW